MLANCSVYISGPFDVCVQRGVHYLHVVLGLFILNNSSFYCFLFFIFSPTFECFHSIDPWFVSSVVVCGRRLLTEAAPHTATVNAALPSALSVSCIFNARGPFSKAVVRCLLGDIDI